LFVIVVVVVVAVVVVIVVIIVIIIHVKVWTFRSESFRSSGYPSVILDFQWILLL
jgi:hypothetical protein